MQQHRAVYLHSMVHISRAYFDVLECPFCQLPKGNQPEHVAGCSVLYLRVCKALHAIADYVVTQMSAMVVIILDTGLCFSIVQDVPPHLVPPPPPCDCSKERSSGRRTRYPGTLCGSFTHC